MSILDYQLSNDALSHAYIFEGINPEDNLAFALDFANKVFNKNGIKISADINPDLYIINKDKAVIDIETIRQMVKDIALRPQNGLIKVYIIHNAQNMRVEGANAILKTIEELKDYNIVIFTTTNSELLLPTIRSRCQLVNIASEDVEADIDYNKLTEIIAEVYKGNIGFYYQHKSFFDGFKDDRYTIIDAISRVFRDVIDLKYNKNTELAGNLSYNLDPLLVMDIDSLEGLVELVEQVKIGFKNNINYDLAIDEVVFSIYRGGNF